LFFDLSLRERSIAIHYYILAAMSKNPIWTNKIKVTDSHPCGERFISEINRLFIVMISPINEKFV
jgi:hypothetical protein